MIVEQITVRFLVHMPEAEVLPNRILEFTVDPKDKPDLLAACLKAYSENLAECVSQAPTFGPIA